MYEPNNKPDYEQVLRQLIEDTAVFDTDMSINGADFIDWFAEYREELKSLLGGSHA